MSSASGSDSESDIEMHTHLPQKSVKKPPKSPQEHLHKDSKKLSTKEMVNSALEELKSRKGVSMQAIKKFVVEKYNVDTDKINFYIKKYIKSGVEAGTIVQTKGIGASGSFKLAPVKKSEVKPKKKKLEKSDKPKKEKSKKSKIIEKEKSTTEKKVTKKEGTKEKSTKEKDVKKPKVKMTKESKKEKVTKESKKGNKTKVVKEKDMNTTLKKKVTMAKRKSIGSIIKPPKMKPTMKPKNK